MQSSPASRHFLSTLFSDNMNLCPSPSVNSSVTSQFTFQINKLFSLFNCCASRPIECAAGSHFHWAPFGAKCKHSDCWALLCLTKYHVTKHHTVKTYGEVEIQLHAFLTWHYMQVSGQIHPPAAGWAPEPVWTRRRRRQKRCLRYSCRESNSGRQ